MSSANNNITNWTVTAQAYSMSAVISNIKSKLVNKQWEQDRATYITLFHTMGTINIVCKLSTTSNSTFSLHIFYILLTHLYSLPLLPIFKRIGHSFLDIESKAFQGCIVFYLRQVVSESLPSISVNIWSTVEQSFLKPV